MKSSFPLESFLKRAAEDFRLLPTHLSLFMAIFYYSEDDDPHASFRVTRRTLMQFARIKSIATYHKCIKELVDFKYITYLPTYDTYQASRVTILQN